MVEKQILEIFFVPSMETGQSRCRLCEAEFKIRPPFSFFVQGDDRMSACPECSLRENFTMSVEDFKTIEECLREAYAKRASKK
ncbi:MAG: hypothetical protein GY941_24000 [Planctomycetes bacterium]|nr:hypothetical protein [Planctomycetota bacterium]